MIKRLFWFALGVVAGIAGVRYLKDKARRAADEFSIESVLEDLVDGATAAAKQVVDIARNLIAKDDTHRPSHDADVFVSGSAMNERSADL